MNEIEALWLEVNIPHLEPLLVCCCYRPPNANSDYLENVCMMIDNVCDHANEIYLMGDLNIGWKSQQCPLRNKLCSITEACGLTQVVTKSTRECLRKDGSKTSTLIDHIFINSGDLCSKAISVPVGCSDHNLVAMVRKTKVPKGEHKISHKII